MPVFRVKRFQSCVLLTGLMLLLSFVPAVAGLSDLLGKKELDESERKETIERIENIQGKLKLLQDKLRAMERRKAAKESATRAAATEGSIPASPVQVNWLPIDETTIPGESGLYTYLLFKGEIADRTAIGMLEDFILTIETLLANEIPDSLANRFLIPVESPQSMINLGRQPYDFKLNAVYLQRLELQDNLPKGPLLVSMQEPVDPYGLGDVPAFLAVSFGRQTPQRALELAQIWHRQDKGTTSKGSPLSDLFWSLIDGAGSTQVSHYQQRTLIELPQP